MKTLVIGAGYVGLGNALVLASKFKTHIIDTDINKVSLINSFVCPIDEEEAGALLKKNSKNISASTELIENSNDYNFCIIATPTNFEEDKNSFNTESIELVLKELNKINFQGVVVIRSTVSIGFTENIIQTFAKLKIIYCPEFLREGMTIHDSYNPSRIIVGGKKQYAELFISLLRKVIKPKAVPIVITSEKEAEAIKLFSNSYLAMRVSFFNELDTFALQNNLSTEKIIEGVSLDKRIGNYYNNPSFGYGGYCLPKDTKQLISSFNDLPQELIKSIDSANIARKRFIADQIIKKNKSKIGIYRLIMKEGTDNFKESSVIDVINLLEELADCKIYIYEPCLKNKKTFLGKKVINNFEHFVNSVELIVANRLSEKLVSLDVEIFSRDLDNYEI